jgi:hypothetical protein
MSVPGTFLGVQKGHTTDRCWHMFDEDYVLQDSTTTSASGSSGHDTTWYTDFGATDHITSDLEKLVVCDKYHGNDQIHTASGSDMNISHIGHSTIHTPCRQLQLNKILHVPQASKDLIYVHLLASNNNVFLEFHPHFFCSKDLDTRNILLKGSCQGGLYHLPASTFKKLACGVNKSVLGVNKPSIKRWHNRLGHPTLPIIQRVIRKINLPFLAHEEKVLVCDACQQAKSHHLPYPISTSTSSHPLELAFTDVWGAAPESVNHYKYYVSFIDDYSKFT